MPELILMMVALFALMYFLMIRPQQKRMKEHQQMQAELAPGERVLLTSGMFGTITHIGERQLIVELAPGVEVTVLKGNIARRVVAGDEEFEFTDGETIIEEDMDDAIVDDASVDEPIYDESVYADRTDTPEDVQAFEDVRRTEDNK